jgi:uncharacterized membrane protein
VPLRVSSLHLDWAVLALVLVVALGGWLRIDHLDSKVYWHDEAHTSLRIFGYPLQDFVRDAFRGQVLSVDQIQRYQRPSPDKGLSDTLTLLAQRPEHGPLYYLLAHFCAGAFDQPQVGARAVSAVLSLLLMPLMYLLGLELFHDRWAAGVAAALAAVSPMHLLYAQEAREYALWTVTIVGSSVAFMRALRVRTTRAWWVYACTLVVGLYSDLLFAVTALAHGLYLFTSPDDRRRSARPFAAALGFSCLAFSPWLYLLATQAQEVHEVTGWMRRDLGLDRLISAWLQHFGHLFLDFPAGDYWWVPSLLLSGAAAYVFGRTHESGARRFLLALIGLSAAAVILPDLLAGGRRSAEARYLMPVWVGLELMVAYAVTRFLKAPSRTMRLVGQAALGGLVVGGLLSSLAISRADTWWSKGVSYFNPEFARIINSGKRPLVVSTNADINPGEVLSLSYLLDPKVRLLLTDYGQVPDIPTGFTDVFLLNPSREMQEELGARYRLEALHSSGRLWRVLPEPQGTESPAPLQAGSAPARDAAHCLPSG